MNAVKEAAEVIDRYAKIENEKEIVKYLCKEAFAYLLLEIFVTLVVIGAVMLIRV